MRGTTLSFQSTLLMRGATSCTAASAVDIRFQSTLLMRGATQDRRDRQPHHQISIHAPHARSDGWRDGRRDAEDISIHAPHARSDTASADKSAAAETFQSTLLMRGATCWARWVPIWTNFNPRSSCEERLPYKIGYDNWHSFQSTLLMRGATSRSCMASGTCDFNPRSSCEERHSKM